MSDRFTGHCSCGAVTFEFSNAPDFVANCSCRDCQRSSGAVMATYFRVRDDDFTVLSGDPSSYPYVADSGNTLERRFCSTCGDRLFTDELSGFPGQVFARLGSMDEPARIKPPVIEIFTAHRMSWAKALDVPQYWTRPDADPDAPRDRPSAGCG
jgi:hypothetical protein